MRLNFAVMLEICNQENLLTVAISNLFISENVIYVLSDERTTYNGAENVCRSYGGELAEIRNQNQRNFFNNAVQNKYIAQGSSEYFVMCMTN